MQAVLLDMVSSKIKRDSLIIVDESDIEKLYARKMEGLKLVHNGSKSIQTKGYNQLSIVARVDNERGCNLLPVCNDLIPTDLETYSIKQIPQDKLINITI